jgi:hypothetical protein
MTQINHFSVSALTHGLLFVLFAQTLWTVPSKSRATRLLLVYCLFAVGNFTTAFAYSALNVPWQGVLGETQFIWLLAAQWSFTEFAYEFGAAQCRYRRGERTIARTCCAAFILTGSAITLTILIPTFPAGEIWLSVRWLRDCGLFVMTLWAVVVFLRQRSFRARLLAVCALLLVIVFVLSLLRGFMLVSFLSSAVVSNILVTLYIGGLFLVYCNSMVETVSVANKLRMAVLAMVFLLVSPAFVAVLLDRQQEYEERELRVVQSIDSVLCLPHHDSASLRLDLERPCRAAAVKAVLVQTANIRRAHIEQYFVSGHAPNSASRLLYVADAELSERYAGGVNGFDAGETCSEAS